MRFLELFEQGYGKPLAFNIPAKIAAVKAKPDYRQKTHSTKYRVSQVPSYVPTVDAPPPSKSSSEPKSTEKSLPLRIGKEVIRPTDPRYSAIMSLLHRQKRQP